MFAKLPKSGACQMTEMLEMPKLPFRMAAVSGKKPLHFNFMPDAAARALIAQSLALLDLPEFAFKGSLAPESRGDVGLSAKMTAVVVQPCAITLAPVRSRLGDDCERRYIRDYQEPDADEMEIGPDDQEAMPEIIDIAAIAIEALTLALPLYPRAKDAALSQAVFAPPGVAPLRDADLRPFAGLAGLADALKSAKTDEN
jgi:uncharacterized metal-binding protein YceD (DUF177 family)